MIYDSEMKLSDLIDSLIEEADISLSIPKSSYVRWYNEIEQILYTEYINDFGKVEIDYTDIVNDKIHLRDYYKADTGGEFTLIATGTEDASHLLVSTVILDIPEAAEGMKVTLSSPDVSDSANVRFDDIVNIYSDVYELERVSAKGSVLFSDRECYYRSENDIVLNTTSNPDKVIVIYKHRPVLKLETYTGAEPNMSVPVEFINMMAAKLRGEAYKLANEDGIAAKWLQDFNTQLETFKAWIQNRTVYYGG